MHGRRVALILWLAAVPATAASRLSSEDARAEFLALMDRVAPRSGAVIAYYMYPGEQYHARSFIGVDFASGRSVSANGAGWFLYDEQRRASAWWKEQGGFGTAEGYNGPIEPNSRLVPHLPAWMQRNIAVWPQLVVDVRDGPDGGYVATLHDPEYALWHPKPPQPIETVWDASGRLLRYQVWNGWEECEASRLEPESIQLDATRGSETAPQNLMQVLYKEAVPSDWFTPGHAQRLFDGYEIRFVPKAHWYGEDDMSSPPLDRPGGGALGWLAIALPTVGGLLVIGGVVVLIRRRGA